MRRHRDFDEYLSEKIRRKKTYAHGFFLELLKDMDDVKALSVEEAIKMVIQIMGVKEFAKFTNQASSNVVDFLKGRRHPKQSTLDAYLKPFGLKTVFAVKEIRKAA